MILKGKPKKKQLIECWDKLIGEWEKETKKNLISTAYIKTIHDIAKQNRILGLVCAYYLLSYGKSEGIEFAKCHGVNVRKANQEGADQVRDKLLQIDTQIRIGKIQKKEKQGREHDEPSFYDLIMSAKEILGIEISNDINCLEWIAIKALIEKKNGRDTKGGRANSVRQAK